MEGHTQEAYLLSGGTMEVAGNTFSRLKASGSDKVKEDVDVKDIQVFQQVSDSSSLSTDVISSSDPGQQTLHAVLSQQTHTGTEDQVHHALSTVYTQLPAALQEENGEYRQVYLAVPQTDGNSTLGALSETLSEEQQQAFLAMAVPVSSQQLAIGESQTLVIHPVGQNGIHGSTPDGRTQTIMVSSSGQLMLQQTSQEPDDAATNLYTQCEVASNNTDSIQPLGSPQTDAMMYIPSAVVGTHDNIKTCITTLDSNSTLPSVVESLSHSLPLKRDPEAICKSVDSVPQKGLQTTSQVHELHYINQGHPKISTSNLQDPGRVSLVDPSQHDSLKKILSAKPAEKYEVFSSVKATLSSALLSAIPGSKSVYLGQLERDCQVSMEKDPDTDAVTVNGDLQHVILVQRALKQFLQLPDAQDSAYPADTLPKLTSLQEKVHCSDKRDKAVLCDLLKPQYSRSGREVKRRHLDINPEDLYTAKKVHATPPKISSKVPHIVTSSNSKRRGRPRKTPSKLVENVDIEMMEENPKISYPDSVENEMAKISGRNEQSIQISPAKDSTILPQDMDSSKDNIVGVSSDMLAEIAEEIGLTGGDDDDDDADDSVSLGPESGEIVLDMELVGQHDNFKSNNSGSHSEKENHVTEGTESSETLQVKMKSVKSASSPSVQSGRISIGRPKPKKDYEKLAPFKFFCNQCSFKSKRESHFRNHRKLHDEKNMPLLQCQKCDFRTLRLGHLRRHELSHSSDVFSCKQCKYRTDNSKLLARHVRIKHAKDVESSNENENLLSCPQCDYMTTRKHYLQRHIRIHTNADVANSGEIVFADLVTKFTCPHCPYKTTRKEHFSRHMSNVHSDTRPFLCDLCGKAFKRQDALKQHRLVHTEKELRSYPFHCHICNKGFRSQAHLNEHRTMHSNIRSYLCEICGASFKTKSVQRKHVLTIHNNPRAFHCSQCSKRFNTKYALRRHVRTHDTPGMRLMQQAMEAIGGTTGQTVQVITTSLGQDLQAVTQQTETISTIDTQQLNTEVVSTAAIEETYQDTGHDGEVALHTLPQATYIQTTPGDPGEATTAVVFLNIAPFDLERVTVQSTTE